MKKLASGDSDGTNTSDGNEIIARACPVCLACVPIVFILLGVAVENSEGRLPLEL